MLTWRHSCYLLVASLILITGCSQPETTITPTFTPLPPTASATTEPTATSTVVPTPLLTPIPGPPPYPLLPSTNVFASLVPDGAYGVIGIGEFTAAAASPDESLTALTTSIGLIMLDTQSFDEVWSVGGDYDYHGELYWSPDGSKIGVISDRVFEIRDANTGELLQSWNSMLIYGSVYDWWYGAAWSPDSSLIALIANEVSIWNVDTGELVHRIEYDEEYYPVYDLVWSSDGTQLAAGMRSTEVKRAIVWNTRSGEVLHQIEDNPMNWSDDLSLLLTRNYDSNSWTLWDVAVGEKVLEATGFSKVSPDWSMVASRFVSQITIYDIQSRSIVYSFNHPTASMFPIEWSPDSTRLAAFNMESAYVWDLPSGELVFSTEQLKIRDVDPERGMEFIWYPDSQKFITGIAEDSGLVVWDIEAGGNPRIIEGEVEAINDPVFLSGGAQLLYHFAHGLSLWDTQRPELKNQLVETRAGKMTWSEDGSQLVTPLGDDFVAIWDVETTTATRIESRDSLPELHFGDGIGLGVDGKVFSPDGRFYATQYNIMEETENGPTYHDGIAIWDAASDEMVKFLESGYVGGPGYARIWSPDGSLLAATLGQIVYLWDVETGELLDQKTGLSYDALAFSPDGNFLAAGAKGAIILWEITD